MFVVDASVALTWCFAEESTEASRALLRRAGDGEAIAPAIWPAECVNILLMAERRKRLSSAEVEKNITRLQLLRVDIDTEISERSFSDIFTLARQHSLTSYDAAYLELAMRRKLPLATKDMELKAAAQRLGGAIISL